MIEGVGRMQPVAPATAETNGRTGGAELRAGMAASKLPAGVDAPADVSLQRFGRAMAAEAPVDAGKVAALRAAIAAGDYRIDADAVADAMLRQAGA